MNWRFSLLLLVFILGSCAYFNTFYNAQFYYEQALKQYNEKVEEGLTVPVAVRRDFDKAIEKANKVLVKYPDSKWADDAYLIIGKSNFYKGDYLVAKKNFENFIVEYPWSDKIEEVRLWHARCVWKMGDKEFALIELKKYTKEVKNDKYRSEAYFTMGEIYDELGFPDSAVSCYEKAIETSKDDKFCAECQYRIARAYLRGGEIDRAIRSLNKVYDFSPTVRIGNKTQVLLVKIYSEAGRYEEAKGIILKKLADPDNKDIWAELELLLGMIYLKEGDQKAAESRFSEITQNYRRTPQSAEAYYHLAELNMKSGDYKTAQKRYEMVSREDPDSRFAFDAKQKAKLLKRFFKVQKDVEKVWKKIEEIRQVGKDKPTREDSLKDVPESLRRAIEVHRKRALELDSLELFNDYYEKLYELAEMYYFDLSLVDSAIANLKKIVLGKARNRIADKALYTLSYIYNDRGDTAEAKLCIEKLKGEFPLSQYISLIDEDTLRRAGREGEAENLYVKAEKYFDTDPQKAIGILSTIFNEYGDTEYGGKSTLAIAWLYENRMYDIKNSIKWYKIFLDNYRGDPKYSEIESKLRELNSIYDEYVREDSTE